MKTQEEIAARVAERFQDDLFGFEISEYLIFLEFARAKPYLKDDATAESWQHIPLSDEAVLSAMQGYMSFAWEKANTRRGISAWRSLKHYVAWLWLLGEDAFLAEHENFDNYTHYGKPQLVAICEHYGWDWTQWDDDRWIVEEREEGVSAATVLGR